MIVEKTLKTVVQLFPQLNKRRKAQKISRIKNQYFNTKPMISNHRHQIKMMILKPKSIIIWKILSRKTPKNKFSQYFKLIRRNLLKFKTIRSLFKEKVKIMTSFKNKMIMIQDNHDKNKT
jgi:hypothetical protein